MAIIFTSPQYLVLLFLLPLIIFIYLFALKGVKKRSIKFANFDAIKKIKGVEIFSKNITLLYLDVFIIVLVILSLSGLSVTKVFSTSSSSFVLAIDASESMTSIDILPNRLEASKKAAQDFVGFVPEKTNIGVVSFSGSSYIEQEVTDDKSAVKRAIKKIEKKIIGGTDIFDAVISSANMLKGEEAKMVVLFSDGQTNIYKLEETVDYCKKNNVVIFSLGVGKVEGGETEGGFISKLEEDALEILAYNTGGKYYQIENVEEFYNSLNDLVTVSKKRAPYNLSVYLIIIALIVFVIRFILSNTRYRVLP